MDLSRCVWPDAGARRHLALSLQSESENPQTRGLVSLANFDSGSAFDAVNGKNLVLSGALAFNKYHPSARTGLVTAPAWPGTATAGTGVTANAGAIGFLPTFTLAAWVYVDAAGAAGEYFSLISRGGVFENNTNFAFGIRFGTSGQARPFCYGRNVGTLVGAEGTTNLATGWHRVIVTWRSGAQTMYSDNAVVWTAAVGNGTDGSQSLLFGGPNTETSTDRRFSRPAFDLRVYNREWTAAEVAEDFATSLQLFGGPRLGWPSAAAAGGENWLQRGYHWNRSNDSFRG